MKGIGGLYEVRVCDEDGARRIRCRARGILRRNEDKLTVGDLVLLEQEAGEWVIAEVLPRRCRLIRPPLSNLDLLFIVSAAKDPVPSYDTLDKLTAVAVHSGITPVFVVTKADIDGALAERTAALYRRAGFCVFVVQAEEEPKALSAYIQRTVTAGRCAAFAGASGVGKSTLLNRLFPTLSLSTGQISNRISRGRHTTRSVELFEVAGEEGIGFLADTPGFSMLDFLHFDFFTLAELPATFPDFLPHYANCRYADCTHTGEGEGECGVARAVKEGAVAASRHESYRALYTILKEKEKTYPKRGR